MISESYFLQKILSLPFVLAMHRKRWTTFFECFSQKKPESFNMHPFFFFIFGCIFSDLSVSCNVGKRYRNRCCNKLFAAMIKIKQLFKSQYSEIPTNRNSLTFDVRISIQYIIKMNTNWIGKMLQLHNTNLHNTNLPNLA